MSTIVKYPPSASDRPDSEFCGQCGRKCQPIINDNKGFGPCVDGADSPIECADLRRQIVNAHRLALTMEKPVHPATAALVARLGIPATLVTEWLEKSLRVDVIKNGLRLGHHGMEGGLPFVAQLAEWMAEGDADEKLLALIDDLRVHLDPTEDGKRTLSYVEIAGWYQDIATRAADILADPGDWEFGSGECGEE